jgi:signal transduction histidine kinase
MIKPDYILKYFFSPTDTGGYSAEKKSREQTPHEQSVAIQQLKKANSELREAQRAALNMMEDAILAKEALHINERRIRRQKEAFQAAINGLSLANSLNIIGELATEETGARTGFYIADENNAYLHPSWGAGNMPEDYFKEIDGFVIGLDSLACGLAIPTGLPVLTEDVFKEPLWKQWAFIAEKYNFRGCWSFPIKTRENKAVGTFAMYFQESRRATRKDLDLADIVTQTAAIIISDHVNAEERFNAEKALRKSEEKLRSLNISLEKEVEKGVYDLIQQHQILKQAEEVAQSGSWEYDIKTKEFLWSEGMYRLFAIAKRQRVKPDVYLQCVLPDDMEAAFRIVHAITESFSAFEETIRIKFNHSYRLLRIKAVPIKNEHGEVEKILGVDLDVTDAQKSEDKIVQLNGSLSEINKELRLSNKELQYSNDTITALNESMQKINNDLNSANTELKQFSSITANNYTEALRHVYINLETIVTTDARNLSNSSRANLRRAQAAIQKMKLLTNDIHNYLQLYDAGIKTQFVDPNPILLQVTNALKTKIEESNAQVKITELPQMIIDPDLFSRLMTNLIDNAIKFRKSDTDLVITINYTIINRFAAPTNGKDRKNRSNEGNIIVQVADNGIGFTNTDKIFDLFTQLEEQGKYKGAGMGLAICKKIMEMHGGFITAESKPGDGSVFSCYFPPPVNTTARYLPQEK